MIALFYSDHHIFSIDDLNDMQQRFEFISAEDKIYLTTEKDAVRLIKFQDRIEPVAFLCVANQYILFIRPNRRILTSS